MDRIWGRLGPRVASVKAYAEHLAKANPHNSLPLTREPYVSGKAYATDDTPIEAELAITLPKRRISLRMTHREPRW